MRGNRVVALAETARVAVRSENTVSGGFCAFLPAIICGVVAAEALGAFMALMLSVRAVCPDVVAKAAAPAVVQTVQIARFSAPLKPGQRDSAPQAQKGVTIQRAIIKKVARNRHLAVTPREWAIRSRWWWEEQLVAGWDIRKSGRRFRS